MAAGEQNQHIAAAFEREHSRLRNFIRSRVPDRSAAEDILQDVCYELVVAYRLAKPIEHLSAWLFRVARNRIIDLFRKKTPEALSDAAAVTGEGDVLSLEGMLPSPDAGPEAAYARTVLLDQLEAALAELPREQREVFIAHEFQGRRFRDLAAETAVSVNTLLSRKHYAVLHLRKRLQTIYDEFAER
ncbi:MAG: RNA polymerase sigma factor [Candidatus Acidiferrales bacterium]